MIVASVTVTAIIIVITSASSAAATATSTIPAVITSTSAASIPVTATPTVAVTPTAISAVPIPTTTISAATASSAIPTAAAAGFRELNFDFLAVNGCSVQFINCGFSIALIVHCNKCISFSRVEYFFYASELFKFVLQEVTGNIGRYTVDKNLGSITVTHFVFVKISDQVWTCFKCSDIVQALKNSQSILVGCCSSRIA